MVNKLKIGMEKEFILYEEALALKELGFDEECLDFYDDSKELFYNHENKEKIHIGDSVKAPLYQQAFRWFREKYKLHSTVDFQKLKESEDDDDIALYEWKINEQWEVGKDWFDFSYGFKHHSLGFNCVSYEEAELECLRKLIEIVKNK